MPGLDFLAALISPVVGVTQAIYRWWRLTRPMRRVLGGMANDTELCRIFVRDFSIKPGTPLLVREGTHGPVGTVPNVFSLWPDVEGRGVGYVFNALGLAGKTKNIDVIHMSADTGLWDSHLIVLGAQAQKCFDFYQRMEGVMFSMDANNILDITNRLPIMKDPNYGYGIILKTRNPHMRDSGKGTGILIGGFGTLGTAAAAYYFREHLADLGRDFGPKCVGVVVRASVTAGEQAVERLPLFDRVEPRAKR